MSSARRLFALALLLDLVGAGGAALITLRTWQTIVAARSRPLPAVSVGVDGRGLDGALLGAALVALAGVVAVLATRGVIRRIIGLLVASAGLLLAWRAVDSAAAVGHARALSLVIARRGGLGLDPTSATSVRTHPVWPILTIVAAVLIMAAGVLIAAFGAGWSAMSARYEAPGTATAGGEEAMWTALDRGDDPTAHGDG